MPLKSEIWGEQFPLVFPLPYLEKWKSFNLLRKHHEQICTSETGCHHWLFSGTSTFFHRGYCGLDETN
jgi:hypothetical protein